MSALTPGTRIGSYEVLSSLGAGGMGEVYRARDSKLKREVAIKVLPADVASDRERLARFQREAEVLASLNHPNIAHIHGLEEANPSTGSGQAACLALVMELVEGEDLAQRIARGPIPIDEALPIAKQIADALEAAHEQGIIHRDLKPANVKVRTDSTVKVLDFGLAKALQDPRTPGPEDLVNSPTITSPAMTMRGVILGTAAYMAPEQAKGKPVDKRADIWAFGCVLYEMLTGKKAFEGEDVTDTIVAVMSKDPDWAQLPVSTPEGLRRLLARCLDKDRTRRLRDIGDARFDLDDSARRHPSSVHDVRVPARSRVWTLAPWAIAAALAIALVAIGIPRAPQDSADDGGVTRFALTAPTGFISIVGRTGSMAFSPDGRQLAFIAVNSTGRAALLVRTMSSLEPKPVQVSGAVVNWLTTAPSWSPDGRYLVVTAGTSVGGPVRRLDPSGGPAVTLAEWGRAAVWSSAGTIVYGGSDGRLYRVPERGGASAAITEIYSPAGEVAHWPSTFLPDGRRFLYVAQNRELDQTNVFVASIDGGDRTPLPIRAGRVVYAAGWLWYIRDHTLMAQRMDADTARVDGAPVPVAVDVSDFAVSASGSLAITPLDTSTMKMAWLNGQGVAGPAIAEPGSYSGLSRGDLSPDGMRMVFTRPDGAGSTDIWQVDLERNVPTRLAATPTEEDAPIFSPDGKFVVFSSTRDGSGDLYRRAADGSGDDELLFSSPVRKRPTSISPDGSLLLFDQSVAATGADIWILPLTGERKPRPLIVTRALEGYARFSPDGRWVAYCAGETGEPDQVFVEPFPPTGARTRLSTSQGSSPLWSADGRAIYYGTPTGQIMRVAVTMATGSIRAAVPEQVLTAPSLFSHNGFLLDARSRILALSPENSRPQAPTTVILNWPALLKESR